MAKVDDVGEVTYYEEPREPMWAVVFIGVLTLLELAFVGLFVWGLATGTNSVPEQKRLAFYLASAFATLAGILALYRKYFLPDILVVKKRKRKYEDLL